LAAIAASVPSDPLRTVEAAVVTHLLRPTPWHFPSHVRLTSVASTCYPALTQRVAEVLAERFSGIRIARQLSSRASDDRPRFDVLVPSLSPNEITDVLADLWAAVPPLFDARIPSRNHAAAACTVWRSALLVASSDRRRTQLRVWLPDTQSVMVLRRAGAALGVSVASHRRRGDFYFVTVDDPADSITLLRRVGAGPHADAWVQHKTVAA